MGRPSLGGAGADLVLPFQFERPGGHAGHRLAGGVDIAIGAHLAPEFQEAARSLGLQEIFDERRRPPHILLVHLRHEQAARQPVEVMRVGARDAHGRGLFPVLAPHFQQHRMQETKPEQPPGAARHRQLVGEQMMRDAPHRIATRLIGIGGHGGGDEALVRLYRQPLAGQRIKALQLVLHLILGFVLLEPVEMPVGHGGSL